MKKDRLVQLRKKLEEKHRQLEEEVGRNVLYGKGPEDDSIKDLGDQASSAYNREFLFELGNGERRRLKEVALALQKITDGGFGDCERCRSVPSVSIRFGLVVGLLFAIVVTYLTSMNPSRVHVALGGDWAFDVPLMALIAVVFGAGAGLALVLGILRDVTRSYAHRSDPLEAGPRPAPASPVRAAAAAPHEPARPATTHAGRDSLIERRRFAEALEIQARVVQAAPR